MLIVRLSSIRKSPRGKKVGCMSVHESKCPAMTPPAVGRSITVVGPAESSRPLTEGELTGQRASTFLPGSPSSMQTFDLDDSHDQFDSIIAASAAPLSKQ